MRTILELLVLLATVLPITAQFAIAQVPGLPAASSDSSAGNAVSSPVSTETHVRSSSLVSRALLSTVQKKYSTALDIELRALEMVSASYDDLIPREEFLRLLPTSGRESVLAVPFQSTASFRAPDVRVKGLGDPSLSRLYSSDSALESLVEWYQSRYGFDFIVRSIPLSDAGSGAVMTVARAVKRIDNTIVSLMLWNPTQVRAARRSRHGIYSNATSIVVHERSFRPRDLLVAEGPDAAVELTWDVPYHDLIQNVATKYQIDPFLVAALVQQESGFNATAVSVDSAMGLTQMIPGTAELMGVRDATNPHQSLEGGVRYLKLMLSRFGGDVSLALAAYNAGPGNVEKYRGIPPFAETRDYVRRIMSRYREKATGRAPEDGARI